jgi:hypothetical protein
MVAFFRWARDSLSLVRSPGVSPLSEKTFSSDREAPRSGRINRYHALRDEIRAFQPADTPRLRASFSMSSRVASK